MVGPPPPPAPPPAAAAAAACVLASCCRTPPATCEDRFRGGHGPTPRRCAGAAADACDRQQEEHLTVGAIAFIKETEMAHASQRGAWQTSQQGLHTASVWRGGWPACFYTDSSGATFTFKGTKEELQKNIVESPYTKAYPLKIKEYEVETSVKTPVKNKNYNRYTGSDGNQYLLGNNKNLTRFNKATNPAYRKKMMNFINTFRKRGGLPPLRPTEAQINDPNFKLE